MNEDFPNKRKQTPTTTDPPHEGHKRTPKKWHFTGCQTCFCMAYHLRTTIANMNVRINRKENVKVLVEIWLVKFMKHEMWISHAKLMIKHYGNMYRDLCFVPKK